MRLHTTLLLSVLLSNMTISFGKTTLPQSIAQFSLDMYRELSKSYSNENFVFSPTNIHHLFLLIFLGSDGNTASELSSTLQIMGLEDSDLRKSVESVFDSLTSADSKKYQLDTAVALFSQIDYGLQSEFRQIAEANFKAQTSSVDFRTQYESIRKDINQWVEEKTKNKIQDLLAPGVVGPDTLLVLVNAIYFKGDWSKKFNPDETRPGVFHNFDGSKATVDMMFLSSRLKVGFLEEYNAEVLELPYADGELSMLIFLPEHDSSLSVLESSLTADHLVNITDELDEIKIDVFLPKFQIEFSTGLNEIFSSMGTNDLFVGGKADMSKMFEQKEVFVSSSIHKAVFEVWEEGSEAMASTAAVLQKRSTKQTFVANRPFLFFVLNNINRLPLYMGRFVRSFDVIKEEL